MKALFKCNEFLVVDICVLFVVFVLILAIKFSPHIFNQYSGTVPGLSCLPMTLGQNIHMQKYPALHDGSTALQKPS